MKYFELGYITKRELEEQLKRAGGLSPWNPTLEPTKIQAGVYTSPGSFVLQADFNGIIDDVSSSSKGTIIYFFKDTQRWGIISGEDKNKGVFQTLAQLQVAYPTATNGDYALVIATNTFFSWFDNQWNDTGSSVAPDALRSTNNLSDLSNKTTARTNLDVFSKKETKDNVGALLVDTDTIDFTYSNTVGNENITATIKDSSIFNSKIASNADIATSKLKQAIITPQIGAFSNNDTQDVINNKAQGQITNLENLLNTRPVGASNGSVYYLTSQASAIPNYELLSFSPDNSPLDIESLTITSTTPKVDRLFHSYISTYEVGNAIINGGNWIFNFYGYTSHINNNNFEIDVYKRDLAGTETLLFSCETSNLLQTSQVSPELNVANVEITKQDFACNTTDKIVVKIYAKTDRTVATTITLLHSGTDYASHIHTTLIASHNQLAGTQGGTANEKYHLNLSDYNKVLGLDASFALKEDAVNKTATFSATPANIKYPTEKLVKDSLDAKVDKVAGKGLSTNDYTTAEQTKLAGIATGATANLTDATLLNRANHTGTQAISTISGLDTALNDKFSKTTSNEFASITEKTTLTDNDVAIIEDSADTNKKKKYTNLNLYNYISGKLTAILDGKVDKTTDQTIGGNKTFSNNITISAIPSDVNHSARLQDVMSYSTAILNQVGQSNGIASLGADGKVPSSQLPSSYDDIFWYNTFSSFPATGATEVMYIAKDTGSIYQWTGAIYAKVGLLNKSDIGLSDVDNTSDINKPISTATQTALNLKENTITAGTTGQYYRGDKTFQTLDKTAVGLPNVDNTSDLNKPISTATQTALNLKTTSTALRQESTRHIEKTYGSDSNNGYTLDKPFQTVQAGWNDVNPSGQVKVGGASQYDVGNFTFNALKESIKTILDEGAKIIGTINLVAGNTSMQFKGGKISATINDASGGTCYFNGVDVSGSTFNISNGGYKFIGNSTSSPTSINLTGTGGTLVLQDITGGVVPLNIGAGWVVVYYNCTPAILSNSGTIIDGFNIPINSLIADQATLNVILAQTSSIYFGYYIVNFDNPVIAGMTIAKGDVFYKVSATTHIKVYTFSNAPASFSLVVSPTQRTTIVKSVDRWIVPTAGSSVVDGAKINVIATDIASASTVNLDNATGDIVNITGTTTITAITLSAGIKRFVRFTGILTLTNGANLVLPSGANIITAVGDTAIFIGYASGVVRCVSYTRANGTALVGGAGSGDVSSIETTTLDNQLVLFDGTTGKSIKKSTDNGFAKLVGGQLQVQTGIGGGDISIGGSTLNNLVAIGSSGTIVDSGKKLNNTDTPSDNDFWSALKTKTYVDASISSDTVSTYTLAYGTGQNLDVSIDKFSIITVSNGDAFVNLPSTLNNSGKVMKIRSDSSSIGRLYINGSEKGTNKYFILGGDTAIFECDNTSWKLITGPDQYITPVFGSQKYNRGRGMVFGYGATLYAMGRGHENQVESPFGAYYDNYIPTPLPLFNNDYSTRYTDTITGWKDVLCTLEFGIALTNEGVVFQWGRDFAGANAPYRNPRKINFPNNEVIESIYMSHQDYTYNTYWSMAFYAISTTGKVYSWGHQDGVWRNLGIGDNTTTSRYTPTLITAIQNKRIVKLAVSGNYAIFCACIDDTGQLYTWGYNGNPTANGNPLGNNVATADTPVNVPTAITGFTDVVDVVAVGNYSTIAGTQFRGYIRILRADGSTWASGYNGAGNLGITGTTSYRVFTRESTNKTNIAKISGGSAYTHCNSIVITKDPDYKVYFAGYNEQGWMGRGDTTDVSNFTLNATQLSAGFQGKMYSDRGVNCQAILAGSIHSGYPVAIILDGDGNLYGCGNNANGILGDGTRTNRNTWYKIKFPTNKRVVDFMVVGWFEDLNRGLVVAFEDGTIASVGRSDNGALGNNVYSSNISYPIPKWVIGFEPKLTNKANGN